MQAIKRRERKLVHAQLYLHPRIPRTIARFFKLKECLAEYFEIPISENPSMETLEAIDAAAIISEYDFPNDTRALLRYCDTYIYIGNASSQRKRQFL